MEKTVLITGGSRGIGAATALLAAQNGYRVVVNFRERKDRAEQIVAQIQAMGGEAIALQADVSQEDQVVHMFEQIDSRFGTISALVNNAGIIAPLSRVEDYDVDRIKRIFEVNVVGAILCAREAIRRMSVSRGGSGGSIINNTSGAARLGSPNDYVDYAASKGAIDTFTIGLAKEVASENIRVNAVRVGFTNTEMNYGEGHSERFERMINTIAMRRMGLPEEIAEAILWLLSDKSSYCTGTILDVTGGR